MNAKLIISICLVLVSMIGVGCVSAADNQTSVQTNVEEMNVEMANEENLIKTQQESVKKVEKSANIIGSKPDGINGNWPFHNGIKDHSNIKNNQTVKSGANNTNNSNNKTHYGPKLDIKGPKVNNTNNSDNENHYGPKLDIKGPKGNNLTPGGPTINGPIKGLKMIKRTKTFDYKGEKIFIAVMQNGSKQELRVFKEESGIGKHCAGMNGAGSSYVTEVGFEIVDIMEEQGVFKRMAYAWGWCAVKVYGLFTDDDEHWNEEEMIQILAFKMWGEEPLE